jgi:hypothetical protein
MKFKQISGQLPCFQQIVEQKFKKMHEHVIIYKW